jgi:hypothetical protein
LVHYVAGAHAIALVVAWSSQAGATVMSATVIMLICNLAWPGDCFYQQPDKRPVLTGLVINPVFRRQDKKSEDKKWREDKWRVDY